MKHLVVGTAGHIDHGKSALVKALTGTDPDRLPEEKERGITIDLGFAHLEVPPDLRLAFVDVPGHERFVKNMLAGAGGVDLVLMVVAADESVMPQTREHFQICRLLGARRGMIALNKSDLADADMVELARLEVEELVRGSFLADAPIVPVSSVTGAGLPEVLAALRQVAADVPERRRDGPFRLPVDRVFTLHGFGTVVTGTALSGRVRSGEELEVLPRGLRVRVRGVQVHGETAAEGSAGERVALNLQGVALEDLDRGDWLAEPGRYPAVHILDARIEVLPEAPAPLKDMDRVRFHLGAAEALARLRVLEPAPIPPGGSGRVQVRLEHAIHAVCGERFVLRRYSPLTTVAGGTVLDPAPPKRSRHDPAAEEHLAALESGEPGRMLLAWTLAAGPAGFPVPDALARTGWTTAALEATAREHEKEGTLVRVAGRLLPAPAWAELLRQAEGKVRAHHAQDPLSLGMMLEELRAALGLGEELFRALVEKAEKEGRLRRDGERVASAGHRVSLSAGDSGLRDALVEEVRRAGLAAPGEEELLKAHPGDATRKILKVLYADGTLVRLRPGLVYHREHLDRLVQTIRSGPRLLEVQDFKQRTGTTRKHAIPLLEWLDEKGVTRRTGDRREVVSPAPGPSGR
jgi:selenocysteine-specific elongation factor